MKIMIDLDRTVFDCPSITYFFGNMSFGETNLNKDLEYVVVDAKKSREYANNLFFLKMSHAKNFTPVDNVLRVLDKWNKQGIEITFVSSRANFKAFHRATVEWFDKYGVRYENIIMDCNNKAKYGELHGFDMLIDDTLKNCTDCLKVGIIPVWVRTKYNKKVVAPEELFQATNWEEIDACVQAMLPYYQTPTFLQEESFQELAAEQL